jgi:uncharacterized membrane protein
MKKIKHRLRETMVDGIFFLVPFVVLLLIIGKAIQMIRVVTVPLAKMLPYDSIMGFAAPRFIGLILLLFSCLLAGHFARTTLGKRFVNWLEEAVLSNLPGYSYLKNLGEEAAGVAPAHKQDAVLVRFDDGWQIGFIVERIPEDKVVVFIPDAPSPWTGAVFIFDKERVKPLNVPSTTAVKCLQKLGQGAGAIMKRMESDNEKAV